MQVEDALPYLNDTINNLQTGGGGLMMHNKIAGDPIT